MQNSTIASLLNDERKCHREPHVSIFHFIQICLEMTHKTQSELKRKKRTLKIQTMTTIAKVRLGIKPDRTVWRRSMDTIYHSKIARTDMADRNKR